MAGVAARTFAASGTAICTPPLPAKHEEWCDCWVGWGRCVSACVRMAVVGANRRFARVVWAVPCDVGESPV